MKQIESIHENNTKILCGISKAYFLDKSIDRRLIEKVDFFLDSCGECTLKNISLDVTITGNEAQNVSTN